MHSTMSLLRGGNECTSSTRLCDIYSIEYRKCRHCRRIHVRRRSRLCEYWRCAVWWHRWTSIQRSTDRLLFQVCVGSKEWSVDERIRVGIAETRQSSMDCRMRLILVSIVRLFASHKWTIIHCRCYQRCYSLIQPKFYRFLFAVNNWWTYLLSSPIALHRYGRTDDIRLTAIENVLIKRCKYHRYGDTWNVDDKCVDICSIVWTADRQRLTTIRHYRQWNSYRWFDGRIAVSGCEKSRTIHSSLS